jgi:hypothetical protein
MRWRPARLGPVLGAPRSPGHGGAGPAWSCAGFRPAQVADPNQVVDGGGEGEHPAHSAHAPVPGLPQQRDRLQPPEDLLHELALLLADQVARMAGDIKLGNPPLQGGRASARRCRSTRACCACARFARAWKSTPLNRASDGPTSIKSSPQRHPSQGPQGQSLKRLECPERPSRLTECRSGFRLVLLVARHGDGVQDCGWKRKSRSATAPPESLSEQRPSWLASGRTGHVGEIGRR